MTLARRTRVPLGIVGLLALGTAYAFSDGASITAGWKQLWVLVVVGPLAFLAELIFQIIFELVCGSVGSVVCFVLGKLPGRVGKFFQRLEGDAIGMVGIVTIVVVAVGCGALAYTWKTSTDA